MQARENYIDDTVTISKSEGQIPMSSLRRSAVNESTAVVLDVPEIGSRSVYAATSKVAGRLNATAVSEEEYQAFLDERQRLLDRKFSGEITRADENRLAYVRWSLDRIEDARHGPSLDKLEEHVGQYENLLLEISKFRNQLERHASRRRR